MIYYSKWNGDGGYYPMPRVGSPKKEKEKEKEEEKKEFIEEKEFKV
jgi:hypothetical protein